MGADSSLRVCAEGDSERDEPGSLQLLEPLPQAVDIGAAPGVEVAPEANVQPAPADDVGHERVAGREPAAGERKRERPHVHAVARPSASLGKVALQYYGQTTLELPLVSAGPVGQLEAA